MLNILFKLFCFFLALNLLTYNWIKKIINKSIFIIYDKRKKIINYFLIILLLCPSIAISISTFDIVNWLRYGKLTFVLNDLNELSLDKLSKLNISELITDLFVWVIAFPIFFPIFFIILIILLNKKLELVAFISKWAIVVHLWITSYWCVSTLRIISSELGKELNVDSKDILYSNTFFNLKRFFNSEELKKLTELYVGSDYIKDNEFIKMLNDFLTSHPGVGWGELKIKVMEFVAIVDAKVSNVVVNDSMSFKKVEDFSTMSDLFLLAGFITVSTLIVVITFITRAGSYPSFPFPPSRRSRRSDSFDLILDEIMIGDYSISEFFYRLFYDNLSFLLSSSRGSCFIFCFLILRDFLS